MKKQRLLTLFGSICLVSILVVLPFMAACAKPAPPPAPAPPPTPAPAPAPAPKPEPAVPPGYTETLKIAHSMPAKTPDYPKHGHAVRFKEQVEKETNGAVKVEIFPLGQLYGDPEAVVAVAAGTIFGAVVDTPVVSAWDKGFEIFSLPGVFMDIDHLKSFMDSEKGGKELQRRVEAKGLHLVYWISAPIHIFTTERQITSLADMEGLKLRTQPAEIIVKGVEALGASGVPMPIGELYTAATTGMVDGVLTQELSISTRMLDEVFHYCLLEPSVFFNNGCSVASIAQLDKMPPGVRKIVEKAWVETATAHEKEDLLGKWTGGSHDDMVERGFVTFNKLSPEARAEFEKAWRSVVVKFGPEIGMELYAESMRLRQ